jgi:putative component of toxin-antitoxin plasmid stabilization module
MRKGQTVILLLAAGDKRTQLRDIELSISLARGSRTES